MNLLRINGSTRAAKLLMCIHVVFVVTVIVNGGLPGKECVRRFKMPYILKEDRPEFDVVLDQLPAEALRTKGDLEYCIARLMDKFMLTRKFSYTHLHDCAYAAEHMCDEFRRLFLDKREDDARRDNGDCFTFHEGKV